MINNLENYNIEIGKDGRIRAYNKINKKVTSYPRLLIENFLNRKLLKTEDVHHKDGNPMNNNIENLEVMDHREHDRLHGGRNKKYEDKTMTCPICNTEFIWTPAQQSQFYSEERTGGPFCSKRCAGINNQRVQAEKGLATKYSDRIEICKGCGEPFLYTAKMQRDRRSKNRSNPFCSIECVYRYNTKYNYDENKLREIQQEIINNNGSLEKASRKLGLSRKSLVGILQRYNLPYHTKDYKK